MTIGITRRRFLTISAVAAAFCGVPAEAQPKVVWRGRALGAEASITLTGHQEDDENRKVFRAVERELSRLERIFSLYNLQSQLVQLNEVGLLTAPAPEMLTLLSLCETLHTVTKGAFDPSLQPLWQAHAAATNAGQVLTEDQKDAAQQSVGWKHLRFDADMIKFDKPGCGLTLNGIAQGFVTDRIAHILQEFGMVDVLIDMGEIAAIGPRDWTVGIAEPVGDVVERITLTERAIATSAPLGTLLVPDHQLGHILDPRDHSARPKHRLVSVSAPTAVLADGLSTAFCLMTAEEIESCLTIFTEAKLEVMI